MLLTQHRLTTWQTWQALPSKQRRGLQCKAAAMLTSSAKGGTTGALISATKYPSARVFQDGDIFEIGYRLSLTV